jgi:lipopolysaccharide transport system permease protein
MLARRGRPPVLDRPPFPRGILLAPAGRGSSDGALSARWLRSCAVTTAPTEPALALPAELPAVPRRSLVGDAWAELKTTVRYRSLLQYLVASSLRKDTANTVMGIAWWVLDPLLQMAIYLLLVLMIRGAAAPDYPIFILTAIISFELFSKGTTSAVNATVSKERSMRQVAFPKSVLPISEVASVAVHFAVAFIVLLLVAIPFGIYPSAIALLALPVVFVQLIFTLAAAFFLSAVNVFVRDTAKLIRYIFRMWFFLSPALYPVSAVPEQFRPFFALNPFTHFFTAYRDVVMQHTVPDFAAIGVLALVSMALLVLAYLFFVRLAPWFAKLV